MEKVNPKLYCYTCDKYYKSQSSLCNHNKKFHSKNKPKISKTSPTHKPNIIQESPKSELLPHENCQVNKKKLFCRYCNKEYVHAQSRWRHEKKCKEDLKIINQNLERENKDLEKENKELKDQLINLLNKTCKVHPKTLQKINNQLNIGSINNITNINIVQLGKENIIDTLSSNEKMKILNSKYLSLVELIKNVHFNKKYPQFNNIAITNIKNDYAYRFNEDENQFIACKKEDLIDDLMDYRTIDLEELMNENKNKLNNKHVIKLKHLVDELYEKSDLYDKNKKDIKLLIYNKSNINDINI